MGQAPFKQVNLSKQVIGVIPARYGSTRFPGKPLALIGGKPMILWVVEAAATSRLLSTILVATDDLRIAKVVSDAGYSAVMTASDLVTGTDRVFAAIKDRSADIVVNIQGDEPLLRAEMLDELVAPLLADSRLEMSTLANEISLEELGNLNVVKVITNQKSDALYFSRFPIPYSRQQPVAGLVCQKHLGLYAYQRHFLEKFCSELPSAIELAESLEQLRALDLGARIRVIKTRHRSLGVDTPEDLAKIEHSLGAVK